MNVKIFGREPTLWISLIGAVVTWVASAGFDWLNAGQAVAVVALATASITAATTRPIEPALFVGIITAGGAMLAEYGTNLSQESIGALGTVVIAVFALFGVRPQVSPVEPSPSD